MKRLLTSATAMAFAALSAGALCEEAAAPEETGPFASGNFSSTIYLTNEYMFRGISNSDGPAIQGSVDWTYNGFFVGAWASNTEFSDANFEIDYYGGYRWNWGDLGLTVQGIYYTYPSEDESGTEGLDPIGVEADYGELNVGASYVFPGELAPSIGANYY
ncbi:MAG: TorF family putative porin, partial [Gammaproteobacteria bacterium]